MYRASDLSLLSKPVVVKILAAANDGWLSSRLQHEIEALARINHPGVVGVLDAGMLSDGSPFLVMQYVEGITLRQTLERGRLEPSRLAAILRQVGAALEAAHAKGIVHGDLKPDNIVLQRLSDGADLVRLIDFGLARVERAEAVSLARAALLSLESESGRRRIPPFVLIQANARQGRVGRALDWLEYMLEKHEVSLITIAVNPLFDPLRSEPRFVRVLETLKLPPNAVPRPSRPPPSR